MIKKCRDKNQKTKIYIFWLAFEIAPLKWWSDLNKNNKRKFFWDTLYKIERMVLYWMKACKWCLFTASLKVSFGCICSASLSSRGPHKAFWNEKSWSSSSSKRILSGGGRYSFWWNILLYHRHCVTRAPPLLLRSWVALFFIVNLSVSSKAHESVMDR